MAAMAAAARARVVAAVLAAGGCDHRYGGARLAYAAAIAERARDRALEGKVELRF
jgi:hypothetical protein